MAEPRITFLDRAIGWLSPGAGLRRHFDRLRLQRAYEAASPRDPWKPRRAGASANADHAMDGRTLRSKSRALKQNVSYIRSGLEARVAHIIGTGMRRKFRGRSGERLNQLWAEWVRVADADGRRDLYGLEADAVRAMDVDGEVLIRLRPRRPEDGLPVPLQLQLLEIDWLDELRTSADNGNAVLNGVEYDAFGRAVAYWLWDNHPGDIGRIKKTARTESRRVSADLIIHLFAAERPGQGRGFPRLAPVISRVRDLQLYQDAELGRKNLETRLGVIVSGDPSMLSDRPEEAQQTGILGDLPSGNVIQVPTGMNITTVAPNVAPGYVDYVKYELHLICSGAGFTYEQATGDMREVNFSSARVRQQDFRREIEQLQWHVVIPVMCQRISDEFARYASLGGQVPGRLDYTVEHSTPKWDYINPAQELTADLLEIGGGMSSISEKLRRRGYDADMVFDELEKDIKGLRDRGILDVLLAMQKTRAEAPEDSGTASAAGR
ncbi:phage portal protein [Caldimonas tepidiphila]|uniref:phage portal protein n=1 Tax=Caldimonas tepidiphila TaxID=2315841 RepID=UPI000E5C33E5|nr:phage portal protein [Caldimonas tepidiphila]